MKFFRKGSVGNLSENIAEHRSKSLDEERTELSSFLMSGIKSLQSRMKKLDSDSAILELVRLPGGKFKLFSATLDGMSQAHVVFMPLGKSLQILDTSFGRGGFFGHEGFRGRVSEEDFLEGITQFVENWEEEFKEE